MAEIVWHRCRTCRGSGRVRREPLDVFEGVVSLGLFTLIRLLVEGDRSDGRWWKNCPACLGCGLVYLSPAAPAKG